MERRLLKLIATPAMLVTLGFGVLLVLTPGAVDWSAPWWWIKLAGVLGLFGFHGACSAWRRAFLEDQNTKPQRFFQNRERGSHPVDGHHRHHGHRTAVLKRRMVGAQGFEPWTR